jgi:hypothetical protein
MYKRTNYFVKGNSILMLHGLQSIKQIAMIVTHGSYTLNLKLKVLSAVNHYRLSLC